MKTKRTLLWVDDEPNVLKSYLRALRKEPYQIITALNGLQGLELLKENPVQVVISDFRMPGMNGVEFLHAVKQFNPAIIRVILSGYADESAVEQAIEVGEISKYLLKPMDNDEMKKEILTFFEIYERIEAPQLE